MSTPDDPGGPTFAPTPGLPIQSGPGRSVAPGDRFDVVVAGAGHNSLVTACYLAKAGNRVLVLEGRPQIGGGAKTAELTLRGFHHDVCACQATRFDDSPIMAELKLKDFGLEFISPDPIKHVPFLDGSYITLWQNFDRTVEEIAKYSKKDADAYVRMADEGDAFKANRSSPSNVWKRRLAMTKLAALRTAFEDDRTRVFMMSPWPVGLVDQSTGLDAYPSRKPLEAGLPRGGMGMVSVSLGRCLEAHGGVILTNKPVERLLIESGRCVGVECGDGSTYRASKAVLSTIHIKRLVQLAPKSLWGDEFLEGVETFDTGTAGLNTHYATTEPLKYPVKGGTLSPVHSGTLTTTARGLAFDYELKAGLVDLEAPVLHVVQCSVADSTRAPEGMHTIRLLGRQPYDLDPGGPERWAEIQEEVSRAHLRMVQKLAPNLTDDKILGRFIVNPVTTERMNPGMWRGSCHGGTDGPAQAGSMRPVPGWADYRMPIAGLYQTGSTTRPEGGVRGLPGRNAAIQMLKDLGSSIEEAVARG